MTRLPVRERSTQAAVTSRTYRKARIDRPPPVAATTAVMRVASRRQRYHAAWRGRPTEPRRSRTPEDAATTGSTTKRMPVFARGTRSGGMRGTRPERSPASTSSAHAKTRRIRSGLSRSGEGSATFISVRVQGDLCQESSRALGHGGGASAGGVTDLQDQCLQHQLEPHQEWQDAQHHGSRRGELVSQIRLQPSVGSEKDPEGEQRQTREHEQGDRREVAQHMLLVETVPVAPKQMEGEGAQDFRQAHRRALPTVARRDRDVQDADVEDVEVDEHVVLEEVAL